MRLETASFFDDFQRNINKNKSFTMTGLTSFSRLLLLKYIREISGKKILFITSTEQLALRYNTDLERIFEMSSSILPYQNTPERLFPENGIPYWSAENPLLAESHRSSLPLRIFP